MTLESQACGTPVIAIQGNAMDRIIMNASKYGALQNNPSSLAEAIHHFSMTEQSQERLEIAAFVKSHYDWKNVFERLFSIYGEVIASYRAR